MRSSLSELLVRPERHRRRSQQVQKPKLKERLVSLLMGQA
jgi:hypothetical protein